MSDMNKSKEFYGVIKKPVMSAKEERVARDMLTRIRQLQRRDRKEQLYSSPPKKSVSS
jgi:hypothetical protein